MANVPPRLLQFATKYFWQGLICCLLTLLCLAATAAFDVGSHIRL
jgi:hypothetical protein